MNWRPTIKSDLLSLPNVEIEHQICEGGKISFNNIHGIYSCSICVTTWTDIWVVAAKEDDIASRFLTRIPTSEKLYKLIEVQEGPNEYTVVVEIDPVPENEVSFKDLFEDIEFI